MTETSPSSGSPSRRRYDAPTGTTNGVEMLVPIFAEVLGSSARPRPTSASGARAPRDYLAGRAFSFISAIDAIGPVPPINESHVEADAAWALYEAWVQDPDRRGRHRAGLRLRQVLGRQPAPHPGPAARPVHARAAVARLGRGRRPAGPARASTPGCGASAAMAEVAVRSRRDAETNAYAQVTGSQGRRRAARRADYLADPAAPPRLRTDHRRRGRDRARRRRPGPRAASSEPGLDHRHRSTASTPPTLAPAT